MTERRIEPASTSDGVPGSAADGDPGAVPSGRDMFVADRIAKRFGETGAVRDVSLRVREGESVAVVGPSGSGKTTLLHLLAGIIPPDTGTIDLDGRPLGSFRSQRELAPLVGVIHQQFDLVPHLRVVHNVLAGRLGHWGLGRGLLSLVRPREAELAHAALDRVGIADKLGERTSRLSGGEQQRVALARLLVQDPRAILADEPISSLDPARGADVLAMLVGVAREEGRTLVASIHQADLARRSFGRIVGLRDGSIVFDRAAGEVSDDELRSLYALPGSSGDGLWTG